MDEKLSFVSRFLDGEKIASLCREFGISRANGRSIVDRYRQCGSRSSSTAAVAWPAYSTAAEAA